VRVPEQFSHIEPVLCCQGSHFFANVTCSGSSYYFALTLVVVYSQTVGDLEAGFQEKANESSDHSQVVRILTDFK